MAIPVGTVVDINPFVAAGCTNPRGRVVKCCQELSCADGTAGQEVVTAVYTVRYMQSCCNECAVHESTFCEFELTPVPIIP